MLLKLKEIKAMETHKNSSNAGRDMRPAKIKVWDILVRTFHWSLVITYLVAWITADEWDKVHNYAGYFIGILLIIRIIWGLIGTKYARFSQFIYRPSTVIAYIKDSLDNKSKRYIGHNPAGGAMVVALLLSLIGVTITGIMMTMNAFWGSEWVEEIHEFFAFLTLGLVIFHIAGVIFSGLAHKENLVKAMLTGWKRP